MGGIWLVGTPFGLYGMSGEPQGPPKGIFCPKCWPFGDPRSAVEVFEEAGAHMIWIRLSQTDQPVAVGPKVGPPGPSEDIWGPQKGLSGPKRALLGAPGVP